ncbi:restriction endonuclease subunit S [Escherichia coli]|uniref:restriction endonuclease subunit S n=1 Tax=Escherichia coli TaxID=562 RepID=UPI001AE77598|nr:restriction endonuclease subunit S [Escherichia coli]MBP0723044.1 restriction endonuclease subunit S [Escherichia coli]
MSELSYLEKLLDGVEVEWLSLGELGDFIRGNGLQKKDFVESGFPAIHYGQIYTRYGLSADKTFTYVLPELANKLRKAQKNDLLLATTSENDEDVVKPLAWLGDNVAISGDMMLFRHEQNVKYLAYFFQSEIFQTQKMKYITGAKVRRVSSGDLSKIKIPIPSSNNPEKSLTIQSEIVRILDKFTALTAELTAELTMRKKQYNYYRDQLLSFEGGSVEWKSLGEVAIITIGAFVRKDKQNPDADYPVYNGGRTPTGYYEDFNNDGDKIIVSARGANAGFVNKSSTPYWAGNSCYSISVRSTEQLHWMYVYYYLKQSETKLTGIQQKGGIPAVSKKQMEDLLLPIPSKSEQVRIVTILDKFDTLTSSITEGLPREIELRQKQYEYYRDLLFSFPKPDAVSH